MEELTLRNPVFTLNRKQLLPAGTVISPGLMEELASSNRSTPPKLFPFLDHGTVKGDLLSYLHNPPYRVIFSEPDDVKHTLDTMARVRVRAPILESLDYFHRYDFFTYRHILLVYALSTLIAGDVLDDAEAWFTLVGTGPTHDFGKTCVPLDILRKTTPLTTAERRSLEHHTIAGHILLSYHLGQSADLAAVVARDHHERRNGSGYPRGISQDDLMVEIIAASDVYDALISPRPYRSISYDNRSALEVITSMAEGGEIDWAVVRALVARNRKRKLTKKEWTVSMEKRGSPPPGNLYGIILDKDPGID